MKGRNDYSGGRRACDGQMCNRRHGPIYSLCTASFVCTLLLVGVHNGLVAKFRRGVDVVQPSVSTMVSGLPCCIQCNPDIVKKFNQIGRNRGEDEFLLHRRFLTDDEKYMYYAPHSGFNNQVMELKNALKVAKILNRTLVIPPVLDHHAAWLGSCSKRRVLRPHRLRALVWKTIFDLISNSRYTSIADIVDISSITPSLVKTIDLRIFLALWCGIDIRASCGGILCKKFAEEVFVWGEHETCVQLLNPMPQAQKNCCVYGVEHDCTSTLWTYSPKLQNDATAATRDLHVDSLRRRSPKVAAVYKIESPKPRNVGRRALLAKRMPNKYWKVEKANMSKIEVLDIRRSLGPNSSAGNSSVLAFGSMFSSIYKDIQSHIDIKVPSGDNDLDDLISSLKLLLFSSEILAAGKAYIREEVTQPFYCAQVRLLDGQFKSHWNATFRNLKAQLTSYHSIHKSRNPIPIFVMTDLPYENWTKTDLKEMMDSRNSYQLHKLDTWGDLISMTSRRILTAESGFEVGSGSNDLRGLRHEKPSPISRKNPHVELAVEEVVCSCARLGFFGTYGSTIADSIRDMRATDICTDLSAGVETLIYYNASPFQ